MGDFFVSKKNSALKITYFLATFAVFCQSATAEEWAPIGSDSNNSEYYIDTDSILQKSAWTEFWLKTDASSDSTVDYRERKTLVRMECEKKRMATVYAVIYMPDGTNSSYGPYEYPQMIPIVPGTVGGWFAEFVCR